MLAAEARPFHVDRLHETPTLQRRLIDIFETDHTCVVGKNVKSSVAIYNASDQESPLLSFSDVVLHELRVRADLCGGLATIRSVDVRNDHLGPSPASTTASALPRPSAPLVTMQIFPSIHPTAIPPDNPRNHIRPDRPGRYKSDRRRSQNSPGHPISRARWVPCRRPRTTNRRRA